MAKAIVFTSGKGGVGKSTLTLSVGRALAELSARVVLMDTDIGLNNLDVLMNVEHSIVYDLVDVIAGRCRLSQALVPDSASKGVSLLPSSHSYSDCYADGQAFRAVVNRLKATFDYVLIDCPAGVEYGFHRAVAAADEAVVVTSSHLSALKDAGKVAALIRSYKLPVSLVINRARGDMIVGGDALSPAEIEQTMGLTVLGVVPEDDEVNRLSCGTCVAVKGEGKRATKILAQNIHYGTNEIFDVTKKYKGMLGGIKRRLRRKV